MATAFSLGGSNSNGRKKQVDLIDIAALIILPFMGGFIFEVFSFQINVFGGYDFTAPIWTVGGSDISLALILTVLSFAWIVVTNLLNDETEHHPYEFAIIFVAIGSPVAVVFIPAFASLVFWHDLTQLMFLIYLIGASVYTSYVG
ncbi:hypothetical protein [Halomontanus rarus]|uniref:hypothetical protein n=1 Tax=Halomontanus rarus TaxID=3034020 RepID=UPI0023E7CD59|nr:hypothetical protein [Halovivax sp. TS33]